MRVLVVHNRYQQAGGEDTVFANEVALLRDGGCDVETLVVSNDDIVGNWGRLTAAVGVISNQRGRSIVADAVSRFGPDVVHVHNFFPLLSPSVFDACADAGVPAVWTLHNFRVTCANGLLFREGQVCEDCVGSRPWPAVRHRCYRDSTAASLAAAGMIEWHRARGTWRQHVARFIALSEFARDLFIRAGLPAERLVVKPNFVAHPRPSSSSTQADRKGALFVGRLSAEKGAATMVAAWRELPGISLNIIGDGPEHAKLMAAAGPNVHFMGFRDRAAVVRAMAEAQALIVPSEWLEPFGMVVAEAMALGTPVIASRIGALASIVADSRNGLHFAPGDAADLARVVRSAFNNAQMLADMGLGARATWEATMAPSRNFERLVEIYREAIAA